MHPDRFLYKDLQRTQERFQVIDLPRVERVDVTRDHHIAIDDKFVLGFTEVGTEQADTVIAWRMGVGVIVVQDEPILWYPSRSNSRYPRYYFLNPAPTTSIFLDNTYRIDYERSLDEQDSQFQLRIHSRQPVSISYLPGRWEPMDIKRHLQETR